MTTGASRGTWTAPPTARRPWTEESIREALAPILAGRDTWPTYREFIAVGAKGVRDAVARLHGTQWWAAEMGVRGGDRRQGGVHRWNDRTIRDALAKFLADRARWPTAAEFRSTGRGGLYEALRHHGGTRRWAAEMGVAPPARRPPHLRGGKGSTQSSPPQPTRRSWTEERIAAALATFLADRDEWPPYADFVAAGRKRLYRATCNAGGPQLWAQRIGVRYVQRRGGLPAYWTEDRVRERLTRLLAGRATWPTGAEFHAAGEDRLLAAVWRLGGSARWMSEFGLDPPPRHGTAPRPTARTPAEPRRVWTDDAIEAAVRPLVIELGRWPTKSEFRAAGLINALTAIYEYGGRARWQRRLGLPATRRAVRVPDRTRWSDEVIERELRRVCAGRATWPSLSEFSVMGALPLYRAAGRHGGIRGWRQRIGL